MKYVSKADSHPATSTPMAYLNTEQITDYDAQYTGRCEAYILEDLVKEFKKKGNGSE